MKQKIMISICIVLGTAFLAAFAVGGYHMIRIIGGYDSGMSEYTDLSSEVAFTPTNEVVRKPGASSPGGSDEDGVDAASSSGVEFSIDFDTLLQKNKDTVAWIRFYPEPSIINYPVVQTKDNDTYLHRTFSGAENTLGAIFVHCDNSPDFSDANTVIYGHRMKNKSMFYQLQSYKDSSFCTKNPYFYIYTPDGRKLTYQVFSVGQVNSESSTYNTVFDEAGFDRFLSDLKQVQYYDTGVDVKYGDKIVTLSTCTAASDDNRLTVRGVLVEEETVF